MTTRASLATITLVATYLAIFLFGLWLGPCLSRESPPRSEDAGLDAGAGR